MQRLFVGTVMSRRTSSRREPPGPEGYPLVGSMTDFFGDRIQAFEEWVEEYGDVVRVSVAGDSYYLLAHPDHVQQVLVGNQDAFRLAQIQRQAFAPVTGSEGLLLAEGDRWRTQRELIQPAFTGENVTEYASTIVDYAEQVAGEWSDGETVAINDEMRQLSLQILAQTLFGQDIRDRETVVRRAGEAITAKYGSGSLHYALPDWVPTPTNRRFKRAISDLDQAIDSLVQEYRTADDPRDGRRDTLLSQLVRAETENGGGLSDKALRDNLKGFLFGGQGTGALAMTYAWFLLGKYPAARASLVDELDTVLGGTAPTVADLDRLEYTERVVKEALRLYPPVPNIVREAIQHVDISGYTIDPGAAVVLPQSLVHRDERFYDEPAVFRPDRWTDEFEAGLHDGAYFPFGSGPKRCVARQYALVQTQLVLATIAQQVDLELVSKTPLERVPAITGPPKNDIRMQVHRRR